MRALNVFTLLVILGSLNWGLFGLLHIDLVADTFGGDSNLSRLVYVLIGLAAIWQLIPLFNSFAMDEAAAERGHSIR
jgi:uncharacterized protein